MTINWYWHSKEGVLYYPDGTIAVDFEGSASLQDAEDWVLEQVQTADIDMGWACAMAIGRVVKGTPPEP